jgi:hypothetical protein
MGNGYSVMRSPKAAQKSHHKQTLMRECGGTNNMARHLYGGTDGQDTNRAFAVVALDDVPNYVPATTTFGYDNSTGTHYGAKRSDGTVTHYVAHDYTSLQKRAARKDMAVQEYCEFIGTPYNEQMG